MHFRYFVVTFVILLAAVAEAQDNQHMVLEAAHTTGISVDGVLDEAEWAEVEPATDFIQFNPTEGEPATQRTEVRVLYGSNSVYVGATMYDDKQDGTFWVRTMCQ